MNLNLQQAYIASRLQKLSELKDDEILLILEPEQDGSYSVIKPNNKPLITFDKKNKLYTVQGINIGSLKDVRSQYETPLILKSDVLAKYIQYDSKSPKLYFADHLPNDSVIPINHVLEESKKICMDL